MSDMGDGAESFGRVSESDTPLPISADRLAQLLARITAEIEASRPQTLRGPLIDELFGHEPAQRSARLTGDLRHD